LQISLNQFEDYNEAIRLNPDSAGVYNNRGNARQNNGNLDGAIEDYNEAIRLNPDNVTVYVNRGAAYWNKEDFRKCVADWEKTLELDPNHEIAKEWLPKARAKPQYRSLKEIDPKMYDAIFGKDKDKE
jgi:tetratricopeptide (TPR) repeat protein